MARINLLPWRQEERERKNKEFLALTAATAVLAILGILLALTFLNNTLSNQELANQKIEDENARLDSVLADIATLEQQRDAMLSRIKIIQDLQGRRSVPVRIWDDIARATPQALYLTAMKREGDLITLTGRADNANIVSEFARNLNNSRWLMSAGIPNISNDIQAYSTSNTSSAGNNSSADNSNVSRPSYPEDRYVSFVVTIIISSQAVNAEGNNVGDGMDSVQAVDDSALAMSSTDPQAVGAEPAQPAPTQNVADSASGVTNEQPAGGQ